jgi:hypothetical protein
VIAHFSHPDVNCFRYLLGERDSHNSLSRYSLQDVRTFGPRISDTHSLKSVHDEIKDDTVLHSQQSNEEHDVCEQDEECPGFDTSPATFEHAHFHHRRQGFNVRPYRKGKVIAHFSHLIPTVFDTCQVSRNHVTHSLDTHSMMFTRLALIFRILTLSVMFIMMSRVTLFCA